MQKYGIAHVFIISFSIKLFLCDSEGERMVEVTNEEQQEKLNEAGHLLLEVRGMQDNLDYYFILCRITNLIIKIEKLIND